MPRPQKLSELIDSIYDAGICPELWSDVVVQLNAFFGTQACGLISKDPVSRFGETHYYCGVDPHFIQLYAETYSRYDPLRTLPPYGEVRNIPDLVDFDEYRRGRFYQEWLRPQHCVDAVLAVLERSKSSCPVLLTVLPGKEMLDAKQRARIRMIIPHASRALMINRAMEEKQQEARAFADVLDQISAGVILLGSSCRIIWSNRAAKTMLSADDFLRSVSGRLVARSPSADRALRDVFRNEAAVGAAAGHAITLISDDSIYYVAQVMPLSALLRCGTTPRTLNAIGVLFVWKAELDSRSCVELFARAFELTPTEIKVLQSIIEIGGVPETAERLGVAETTVKTHLHRVFAKAGVSRQANLVRRAAGFADRLLS